jgi:HSP20 family protein
MTLIKRRNTNNWPSIFDDAFFRDFFDISPKSFGNITKSVPAVNVRETDKAFFVEVAAPGVKKEDFKIEVEDDLLTISTESKSETEEKDKEGRYTKREFSYHSFSRSFSLDPDAVDTENIDAKYEDGVLHLEIPKKIKEESKPKKSISVK